MYKQCLLVAEAELKVALAGRSLYGKGVIRRSKEGGDVGFGAEYKLMRDQDCVVGGTGLSAGGVNICMYVDSLAELDVTALVVE
jgi:hypothetical protein